MESQSVLQYDDFKFYWLGCIRGRDESMLMIEDGVITVDGWALGADLRLHQATSD